MTMPDMNTLFQNLPATSRVWVYQSNRPFTPPEAEAVAHAVKTFVSGWTAHAIKVYADGALLHNRFVILAADEHQVGVSGCSIDSSVRFIKELGAQYGVDFFDRFHIAYKDGEEVKSADRAGFEALVASGKITAHTVVYNNLVESLADLRAMWEVPFSQSWHSRVFEVV